MEVVELIISGSGAAIAGMAHIIANRHDKRIASIEEKQDKTEDCVQKGALALSDYKLKNKEDLVIVSRDLSDYKTYSERYFAKEESVQSSLARIHDRIDSGMSELRKGISEILQGQAKK